MFAYTTGKASLPMLAIIAWSMNVLPIYSADDIDGAGTQDITAKQKNTSLSQSLPDIHFVTQSEDIQKCFETFQELRPHLEDLTSFTTQVLSQIKEGYTLAVIYDGDQVAACVGYRVITNLAWGKFLHIDDLITRGIFRCKGYGEHLLNYTISQARSMGCKTVQLDSGYTRFDAHRLYLKKNFNLIAHHLEFKL